MSLSLFLCLALVSSLSRADDYQPPIYYSHGGGYEYVSDGGSSDGSWGGGGGGSRGLQHCEDIPSNMSLCQNIGYTKMRLPNLLDHDSMGEMIQQSKPWVPLLGIGCHENTKLFLCSLFSPVCVDRPIYPCRSICESVKNGCEKTMLNYGYPWPEMLRCDKFPLDNDMCIGPQTGQSNDDSLCKSCDHPSTFEAFVDSFCTSDFAIQLRIEEQLVSGNDVKLTAKSKKKKYKAENISKKELRNLVVYLEEGARCDCPQLTSAGSKDKLVIMGSKQGDRLVVSKIFKYDRKSKPMRQALKAIRKSDTCKKGLGLISSIDDEGAKDDGKGKGKGKKADRKERKDRSRKDEGDKKPREGRRRGDKKERGKKERAGNDRRRNRKAARN